MIVPLQRFLARGEEPLRDPSAGSPIASPCLALSGLSLSPWHLSFPQCRPVLNQCHTSDGAIWVRRSWREILSCLHSCFGWGLSTHQYCQ